MPRPMGHIRIMMSTRVLFNLEQADKIFKEKGREAYTDYICARGKYANEFDPSVGGRLLKKGPLWNFAEAAIKLNQAAGKPLVEIGVSCKDDAQTALPLLRNLDINGMDVEYRMATNGKALSKEDHESFGTDLLLTRNPKDAQLAIDNNIAAAVINFPPNGEQYERKGGRQIRLWVDGDAVAFGSSAEVAYRKAGLEKYKKMEFNKFAQGLEQGPFTKILAKISQLNSSFPKGEEPFEISLLTARGGPSAARVCTIAQKLGIQFNGKLYFMGGAAKVNPLRAHKPDLYFDDQMAHLSEASKVCPTGLVAYKTGSPMYNYTQEQNAKAEAEKKSKSKSDEIADNAKDMTTPMDIKDGEPGDKPKPEQPKTDQNKPDKKKDDNNNKNPRTPRWDL